MDATELRTFIKDNLTRTAFRLETLQQYDPTDPNYRRYLAGKPSPDKGAWLARLRDDYARGLRRSRVRIVTYPISDYTAYECEWGYAPNVDAGEDVRIFDTPGQVAPPAGHGIGDFWLIDDTHVITMTYDANGRFASADLNPTLLEACREVRDALWSSAEPFQTWWTRHPDVHRANRQVA